MNGDIDEVRLYNRTLSADEVKELYFFTSAFPPAEKRENRMVIFLTIKPKTIPDSAENRENVATIVAVI